MENKPPPAIRRLGPLDESTPGEIVLTQRELANGLANTYLNDIRQRTANAHANRCAEKANALSKRRKAGKAQRKARKRHR